MDGFSLGGLVDSPVPKYWGNISILNTRHYCTAEEMWYCAPKQEKLLKACMEHAAGHAGGASNPHAVYVVHPFFHGLCHYEMGGYEYEEYVSRLGTLLERADRSRFDVILFDIPEHYALRTWENAELGQFDEILFTQFGFGRLLDCAFLETGMYGRIEHVRKIGCAGSYVAGQRSACVHEAVSGTAGRELVYPIADALLPSRRGERDELIRGFLEGLGMAGQEFRWVEDMIVQATSGASSSLKKRSRSAGPSS
jgi:hypothetical protein